MLTISRHSMRCDRPAVRSSELDVKRTDAKLFLNNEFTLAKYNYGFDKHFFCLNIIASQTRSRVVNSVELNKPGSTSCQQSQEPYKH